VLVAGDDLGADDADECIAGQGVGWSMARMARFRQPRGGRDHVHDTLAPTEARFSAWSRIARRPREQPGQLLAEPRRSASE
jgi:hypothetical protein